MGRGTHGGEDKLINDPVMGNQNAYWVLLSTQFKPEEQKVFSLSTDMTGDSEKAGFLFIYLKKKKKKFGHRKYF